MLQSVKSWFGIAETKEHVGVETNNSADNKVPIIQETVASDVLTFAKSLGSKFYRNVVESSENAVHLLSGSTRNGLEGSLRTVVEKVPILRDFQTLQDSFAAEQASKSTSLTDMDFSTQSVLLPWDAESAGVSDQALLDKLRARIMELSKHTNTFLLAPPEEAHVDGDVFRSPENIHLAKALLEQDPNLAKMRYELVPTRIREDLFWRNYFYRVSIVRQSFQLSTLTNSGSDDFVVCTDEDQKSCPSSPEESHPEPAVPTPTQRTNRASKRHAKKRSSHKVTEAISSPQMEHPKSVAESKPIPETAFEKLSSPEGLTADELLEAELAREVNDIVLVSSADEEQLERELEEELAQLAPPTDSTKAPH